jgi:hypothetical protein
VAQAFRRGNFNLRVRAQSFEKVLLRLQADYPGESRSRLRTRLSKAATDFAVAFLEAAAHLTEEQRKQTQASFQRSEDARHKKATDPIRPS